MDLVSHIAQELGISREQAQGGTGLVMKLAQEKLGNNFSQVQAAVPGLDSILKSAPKGGIMMVILTLLLGKFGFGKLGSLAGLVKGFSKLGLGQDVLMKFIPVILGFFAKSGNSGLRDLLSKVLK